MSIELKVPAVGESITEVQIGEWLKAEGDHAEKDENLVEIETRQGDGRIAGSGERPDRQIAEAATATRRRSAK